MLRTAYSAFYPSRPFWAASKVNFQSPRFGDWFYDQMTEEIYSNETNEFSLKICRDGRILIRIHSLESSEPFSSNISIEETVKLWGHYLDYLNAFYLLFESSICEIDHLSYFNLHEITTRDAFRIIYENNEPKSENIASESVASIFQMARHLSTYRSDIPIELDQRIFTRQVISLEAISHAGSKFQKVVTSSGSEKQLSSFAKSLAEYKVGNYEMSLVLAWFISEAVISKFWKSHIELQNRDLADGSKRINRDRKDFLTGRDFPASIMSNMLEISGVFDTDLFRDIDTVRGYRNKVVHALGFTPGPDEARLAIKVAHTMIERLFGITFTPNLSYTVNGL